MLKISLKSILIFPLFFSLSVRANIENCSEPVRNIGIEYSGTNDEITVISTAESPYYFNDIESILDAVDEAKYQAILNIVEFKKINISDFSKKIYGDSSVNNLDKDITDPISSNSDYVIKSKSTLKGIKLINYCIFKNQKRIQATVEFSTNSLREALKLESTLKFNENKKNKN